MSKIVEFGQKPQGILGVKGAISISTSLGQGCHIGHLKAIKHPKRTRRTDGHFHLYFKCQTY
jgi:hypothetical protein